MADSKPATIAGPAPVTLTVTSEQGRPNVRLITLLALGHFVIDVNQGSLPAVLPFLKSAHGLSYTQAATIILMGNLTSSLIQPAFGYLADRTARRWLLPVSVLVSGLGLSLTGIAPGYTALLALIVFMGFGVAAYHPEGYRTATGVAGERKATALSWFSLGGNVGVALGPPLMTTLIGALGIAGTLGMLAPSVVMVGLLLLVLPSLTPARVSRVSHATARAAPNMPRAMALLILVVTIRSWASLGFTTFVPFYYIDHLGADPRLVGPLLFAFLGAGAVGTVIAGPIADRVGPLRFLKWIFLAAVPFGVLFLHVEGPAAFVVLGCYGAVLVSSFSVSVVLAQSYLPRNTGMASGLIVGFAMGAGGLGVAVLGWVADRHGVPAALWISALTPLAAFAAARFLPAPRERA